MYRLLLFSLCCLLPALIFAQAPTTTPLSGRVTIVQPHWQFYTNLGAHEQVHVGAMLQLQRDGVVIGTARVLKVNYLDSIAELATDTQRILPQAGDVVILQTNPPDTARPGQIPWIEPNLSMTAQERDAVLVALIALVIALSD